jgi:hypothetical protein
MRESGVAESVGLEVPEPTDEAHESRSDAQARQFKQLCDDLTPGGAAIYSYYRVLGWFSHATNYVIDLYADLDNAESCPRLHRRPSVGEDLDFAVQSDVRDSAGSCRERSRHARRRAYAAASDRGDRSQGGLRSRTSSQRARTPAPGPSIARPVQLRGNSRLNVDEVMPRASRRAERASRGLLIIQRWCRAGESDGRLRQRSRAVRQR